MYCIKVEDGEIDDVLNECSDAEDKGQSKFPGLSYEQGIQSGILWIIGEEAANPLSE